MKESESQADVPNLAETAEMAGTVNHERGVGSISISRLIYQRLHKFASRTPSHRKRRILLLASFGVLLLLLGVNIGGAYYAPSYAGALAKFPAVGSVPGPPLGAAGLSQGAMTPLNSSAFSSGHDIQLVGGYADQLRIVIFYNIDGRPVSTPSKSLRTYEIQGSLRDQFGHTYRQAYDPWTTAATFEPLSGLAIGVGARLTLDVSGLVPTGPGMTPVQGNWQLPLTLIQRALHPLPLPAPITVGDTIYTFTATDLSGNRLTAKWSVQGGAVERIRSLVAPYHNQKSATPQQAAQQAIKLQQDSLWPHVADAAGRTLVIGSFGTTVPQAGPAQGQLNAVLPSAGRYRVWFGSSGAPTSNSAAWIEIA